MGRDPTLPVEIDTGFTINGTTINDYRQEMLARQHEGFRLARQLTEKNRQHMSRAFDAKIRLTEFEKGDKVYLHNHPTGSGKKLAARYSGPYTVTKVLGPNSYVVCVAPDKTIQVHARELRHYLPEGYTEPPPPATTNTPISHESTTTYLLVASLTPCTPFITPKVVHGTTIKLLRKL